jgi:hypothetical protein
VSLMIIWNYTKEHRTILFEHCLDNRVEKLRKSRQISVTVAGSKDYLSTRTCQDETPLAYFARYSPKLREHTT